MHTVAEAQGRPLHSLAGVTAFFFFFFLPIHEQGEFPPVRSIGARKANKASEIKKKKRLLWQSKKLYFFSNAEELNAHYSNQQLAESVSDRENTRKKLTTNMKVYKKYVSAPLRKPSSQFDFDCEV